MSGAVEMGRCQTCGKDEVPIQRTYTHYPIKCECCSDLHFTVAYHCATCEPRQPETIVVHLKVSDLGFSISDNTSDTTKGAAKARHCFDESFCVFPDVPDCKDCPYYKSLHTRKETPVTLTYEEAITAIKHNYPPESYTVLREALDLAMQVLKEKADESKTIKE